MNIMSYGRLFIFLPEFIIIFFFLESIWSAWAGTLAKE